MSQETLEKKDRRVDYSESKLLKNMGNACLKRIDYESEIET